MATDIFECPFCSQKFRLPPDTTESAVLCPGCSQQVRISLQNQPTKPSLSATPTPPPKPKRTASSSPPSPSKKQPPPPPQSNSPTNVFQCGNCDGQFRVPAEHVGQQVTCPHCQAAVETVGATSRPNIDPVPPPDLKPDEDHPDLYAPGFDAAKFKPIEPPSAEKKTRKEKQQAVDKPGDSETPMPENKYETKQKPVQPDPSLLNLLPPKYKVGQDEIPLTPKSGNAVVLPKASGGFQEVDDRFKKINYGDSVVKVRTLTDQQKFWRRTTRGIIVFIVCVAILLATFFILR